MEEEMSIRELIPTKQRHRTRSGSTFGGPLESLHDQLDQVFSDIFPMATFGSLWPERGDGLDFPVKLDVAEKDDVIEVIADLPGLDESDVDVTISDGTLRIKGERITEKEERAKDYYRQERRGGVFNRWIALPCDVDEDKIEAKFRNGTLTINMPKAPSIKEHERKIQVKAA
jgi:HSP20 family protein